MKRWIVGVASAALLGVTWGCAPKAVILNPGPVPMQAEPGWADTAAAWSLWVRGAQDARPPEKAGQRVGVLYTRFEQTPQDVFLETHPAEYVAEQLRRYLLHRGLEASSQEKARMLVDVELQEFALEEVPGALLDEVGVRVAYTVSFVEPNGTVLAKVKVEAQNRVKVPVNAERRAEQAFREALLDTFRALDQSEEFRKVLGRLGG
ncbi:MAG: hypothetical protein D6708_06730 [Candidatus Dadabacteria bacterium]|nr:MAG: hypothetical protein D6708_06730 [Candidatus Dadabacteria bacterium]